MIKHYTAKETFKIKVTKPFFYNMAPTKIGDVLVLPGNLYADLKQRNCVVDFIEDPVPEPNIECENLPDLEKAVKKLGTKRKKKTN